MTKVRFTPEEIQEAVKAIPDGWGWHILALVNSDPSIGHRIHHTQATALEKIGVIGKVPMVGGGPWYAETKLGQLVAEAVGLRLVVEIPSGVVIQEVEPSQPIDPVPCGDLCLRTLNCGFEVMEVKTPKEAVPGTVEALDSQGHHWEPSFFGVEYQTYKCSKCGSGKREQDGEVGYCHGRQTLFTKWDEPEPSCVPATIPLARAKRLEAMDTTEGSPCVGCPGTCGDGTCLDHAQCWSYQNFVEVQRLRKEQARRASPHIGNILDQWEQLPNDLKADPELEALARAMDGLNEAMEGEDEDGSTIVEDLAADLDVTLQEVEPSQPIDPAPIPDSEDFLKWLNDRGEERKFNVEVVDQPDGSKLYKFTVAFDDPTEKARLICLLLDYEYSIPEDADRDARERMDVERQVFAARMGWPNMSVEQLREQVKAMGLEGEDHGQG